MFGEVDYSNSDIIKNEIERIKDNVDLHQHSFLKYIFPHEIKDGKFKLDLDYSLYFIAAKNLVELMSHIKDGREELLPVLSYAHIQTNLGQYYKGVLIQSVFQPFTTSKVITDHQLYTSIEYRLHDMTKERLKADVSFEVSRERITIRFKHLDKEHTKTFKVLINSNMVNDTYIECLFCHICYVLKESISAGNVKVDDRIKQFVLNILDVYAVAYQ